MYTYIVSYIYRETYIYIYLTSFNICFWGHSKFILKKAPSKTVFSRRRWRSPRLPLPAPAPESAEPVAEPQERIVTTEAWNKDD